MEDTSNGERITTSFSEEDYDEYVPFWLATELKERVWSCSELAPLWQPEIAFEIGVALAPYITNLSEVDIFDRILYHSSEAKEEMEEAVHRYAEWVKQTFHKEIARRRREARLKNSCVLCEEYGREPERDVCSKCHKEHWTEEQRIKMQLYRARKAGTPATLTLGEWIATLKRYNYHCAYCQTGPYEVIEHYIPLTCGKGGTTKENCVPACRSCNSKKNNEHPEKQS